MKASARFDGILMVGYFLNGPSFFVVKFSNLMPFGRHLFGRNDW